jgi:hypothetical protein
MRGIRVRTLPRLRGRVGVGAFSLRGPSRGAIDGNQAGLAAIVENSLLRCRFAILDAILVKHVLHDGIRWAVVPSRIMIEVESDCCDGTSADIRASPAASLSQELNSDFEIRVFHQNILA